MSSPEQQPQGPETGIETPRVSAERYEALANKAEKGAEKSLESNEKSAEKARIEALEKAVSVEKGGAEKDRKPKHAAPVRRRGTISKKEKTASFKQHMKQVQAELPPVQRAFSKFIHHPAVEKASEAIGSTVARPNAILAGSVTAFFLVLAVYLIAKNLGYPLSGFETIGAFIAGWVIGLLYDYVKVMVTGKKS